MMIYKITNNLDGKSYIGQSAHKFERRYDCGKWWKYTGNIHLERAAQKYGYENFSVEILEDNIISFDEMDRLEIFYIDKFKSLSPNGYNFLAGGKCARHTNETADKSATALKHGRKYEFMSPDGEFFVVNNLARFCREHNLSRPLMVHVSQRRRKQHKGWTIPGVILKERKYMSPEGIFYTIREREMRPFCRKFGLGRWPMLLVWRGSQKKHKGWTKAK